MNPEAGPTARGVRLPPLEVARMQEDAQRRLRVSKGLSRIRHKVIVMSGKGGVGKTTVSVNLAASLAKRGYDVGVLDMDLTGPDVPLMFGLEGERFNDATGAIRPLVTSPPAVKVVSISFLLPQKDAPVVWRGPLKSQALSSFLGDVDWGDLDFLIVDLPPGTSDEPLSVSQAIPDASGAVIVTTPQAVATLDVRKSLAFTKLLQLRVIGLIENMSGFHCPSCGAHYPVFGRGGGEQLAEEALVPFLGAIPLDVDLVTRGDTGRPFVVDLPGSEAAKAFEACVDKFLLGLSELPRKSQVSP